MDSSHSGHDGTQGDEGGIEKWLAPRAKPVG